MSFLKNILKAKIWNRPLCQSFSSKKSSEQLAYYQHRLETLTNFSIIYLIQLIGPSNQQLLSNTFSTNMPNLTIIRKPLPKWKRYVDESHLFENMERLLSLISDRNIFDFRLPSSPRLRKYLIAEEM